MKKTVYRVFFPSQIKIYSGLSINKDEETVTLEKKFGYYSFKCFNVYPKNIRMFSLGKNCQQVYAIDEYNNVYVIDPYNEIITQKIQRFEQLDFATDCEISGDIIIFAGDHKVSAFSIITWQKIWEIETGIKIKKIRSYDQIIALIGDNGYIIISRTGEIKEKKETPIIELYFEKNSTRALTIGDIKKVQKDIKGSIVLAYIYGDRLFIGTDRYDDETGSIYVFNTKDYVLEDNIPLKKIPSKITLDRCNNMFVLSEGQIIFYPFDFLYSENGYLQFELNSYEGDIQWHRIKIDGKSHEGTSVNIAISTDKKTELTFENSTDIYIPDGLKGKKLKIKISLSSDFSGKKTPVIKRITVYYPRKTYLDYLPHIYKEDRIGKDILERYLSIFQTVNSFLEKKIKDSPYLLDPLTVDLEFLDWLSKWFGIVRDENWGEKKWRTFLKEAYYLFKIRGTRECLERIIEIFTGEKPYIIEQFQMEQCGSKKSVYNDYFFCVYIRPEVVKSYTDLQTIRKIISTFKPSHVEGKVVVMPRMIVLGSFVLIGINSHIHRIKPVIEKGLIGIDSYLQDTHKGSRIGNKSRLSIDTKLEI